MRPSTENCKQHGTTQSKIKSKEYTLCPVTGEGQRAKTTSINYNPQGVELGSSYPLSVLGNAVKG